jgi:hypothetical protein
MRLAAAAGDESLVVEHGLAACGLATCGLVTCGLATSGFAA